MHCDSPSEKMNIIPAVPIENSTVIFIARAAMLSILFLLLRAAHSANSGTSMLARAVIMAAG